MNATATAVSTASLKFESLVTKVHDTRIVRYMTYGAFTVRPPIPYSRRSANAHTRDIFQALIWDWLLSVAEEARLVRRFRASIALFAYFVAR